MRFWMQACLNHIYKKFDNHPSHWFARIHVGSVEIIKTKNNRRQLKKTTTWVAYGQFTAKTSPCDHLHLRLKQKVSLESLAYVSLRSIWRLTPFVDLIKSVINWNTFTRSVRMTKIDRYSVANNKRTPFYLLPAFSLPRRPPCEIETRALGRPIILLMN